MAILNDPDLDVTERESKPPLKKIKLTKILKCNKSYVEYSFTYLYKNNIDLAQCIMCGLLLANVNLKPNKLLRHIETNHSHYKNQSKDFF